MQMRLQFDFKRTKYPSNTEELLQTVSGLESLQSSSLFLWQNARTYLSYIFKMKNVSQTNSLLSVTMVFKGEKLVCVRYRVCFNRQTGQWGCNKALNEVPTIPIHIHTHTH